MVRDCVPACGVCACVRASATYSSQSGKKGHLNSLINIVSYDLCPKMAEHFSRRTFNVIICDESHFLKTYNSKRTLTIVPLIQVR